MTIENTQHTLHNGVIDTSQPEPTQEMKRETTTSDHGDKIPKVKLEWKKWLYHAIEKRWFRDQNLIDQFFMTLESEYLKLQSRETDAKMAPICAKIDALFNGEHTWRNAYQIEQLMVVLYNEVELEQQLKRKRLEASHLGSAKQQHYEEDVSQELTTDAKRALLGELLNDLQWFYESRYVQRSYEGTARLRTIVVFFVTFLFFFLPVWAHSFTHVLEQWGGVRAYFVFAALSSGALGAAFSMLISLRHRLQSSTLDEVKQLQRYSFVISRVVIGMGAATILNYVLQAGMLQGEFLPTPFSGEVPLSKDTQEVMAFKDLALLIVWCFVSGFSEQL